MYIPLSEGERNVGTHRDPRSVHSPIHQLIN
jgi:hypothetical protein